MTNTTISERIRIHLLPLVDAQDLIVLGDRVQQLHHELCWWHEPNCPYVPLPEQWQAEIDAGQWDRELAALQVKGLIQVEVRS